MALKAILNSQPVMAWDVAGTGEFSCVECAEKMHYRRSFKRGDGVRVTAHFAHNPTPVGSTPRACSVGQSEEHMNAKQTICIHAPDHFWWLNGIRGDVEVPLGSRRADVLFTRPDGRRIIFEPQFTKIPRRQIAERTKDYHDLGCDVIWCFPEKRADLYSWAKGYFFCVGRLSNDGNEITFWGNLNPDKHPPGLRAKFDEEVDPDAWKRTDTALQRAVSPPPTFDEVPWGDYRPGVPLHGKYPKAPVYRNPDPMPSIANPPRTMMRDSSAENAYTAWMSAGSMGLSAWLANYKERQNGKRFYTVEEYGDWCAKVRGMEKERTGDNSELCIS